MQPPPPVLRKAVPVAQVAGGSYLNQSFDDDQSQPPMHAIPPAYGPQPTQPSQLHIANQPPIIVPMPSSDDDRRRDKSPLSGEFIIPRARPSRSGDRHSRHRDRDHSHHHHHQTKPVRTPSGREVSAEEYLREYRPVRRRNSRDEGSYY